MPKNICKIRHEIVLNAACYGRASKALRAADSKKSRCWLPPFVFGTSWIPVRRGRSKRSIRRTQQSNRWSRELLCLHSSHRRGLCRYRRSKCFCQCRFHYHSPGRTWGFCSQFRTILLGTHADICRFRLVGNRRFVFVLFYQDNSHIVQCTLFLCNGMETCILHQLKSWNMKLQQPKRVSISSFWHKVSLKFS